MLAVLLFAGGVGFIIGVVTMGIVNWRALRKWRREHE